MLEIKGNYQNKHENKHICFSKLWDLNRLIDTLPVYSDILGTNAEKILKISRLIKSAFEERKLFMKK